MDLNNIFDPVSLVRPDNIELENSNIISRSMFIHTSSTPIPSNLDYKIALIGICEDSAAINKGSSIAPDSIRNNFYQLFKHKSDVSIIDLGNIKPNESISELYYAVILAVEYLLDRDIFPIIMGGSHDLTMPCVSAINKMYNKCSLTTIDARPDFITGSSEDINSRTFIRELIKEKQLFHYVNIASQSYFLDYSDLEFIEKLGFSNIRLGVTQSDLRETEPEIRDSDMLSIDISSVRRADAPGQVAGSPNGLYGEELCTLTRFAGIGESIKVLGIFEIIPEKDIEGQTAMLAAQAIWYFIDGYLTRLLENPSMESDDFKSFIVSIDEETNITFVKSYLTGRWWLAIPNKKGKMNFFACSEKDYHYACTNQFPERWLRHFKNS